MVDGGGVVCAVHAGGMGVGVGAADDLPGCSTAVDFAVDIAVPVFVSPQTFFDAGNASLGVLAGCCVY